MCVPRGLVVKLSPSALKGPSSNLGSTFFSLLLFFSFLLFFFSFSFHFRYNSFVMFLYIAHNFWLTNFLLGFTCRSPQVLREVLRFAYFYLYKFLDCWLKRGFKLRHAINFTCKLGCMLQYRPRALHAICVRVRAAMPVACTVEQQQ